MAKESGLGWSQFGVTAEQIVAGMGEWARAIRAEADQQLSVTRSVNGIIKMPASITDAEAEQFTQRWNEDRNAFRMTQLYAPSPNDGYLPMRNAESLIQTYWPSEDSIEDSPWPGIYPVEAFAACPYCGIPQYPLIISRLNEPGVLALFRECMHCHNTWIQQEQL